MTLPVDLMAIMESRTSYRLVGLSFSAKLEMHSSTINFLGDVTRVALILQQLKLVFGVSYH